MSLLLLSTIKVKLMVETMQNAYYVLFYSSSTKKIPFIAWKLGETFYSAGKTGKGNWQDKQTLDAAKTIKKQWAH